MVQEQLTDYISSQMKLGISRDAIKSALVSAGWVSGDVEDTLKKVEGGSSAAATATPATTAQPMTTTKPMQSQPMGGMSTAKSSDPQMIRVGDLVSSSKPTTTSSPKIDTASMASKFGGTIKGNSFEAKPAVGAGMATATGGTSSTKGSRTIIVEVIGGILILALAGLAWYFYSGNAALASQVNSLNTQSASVTAQLTALKSQVDASSTNFAAEISSLTAANADLALNLSFYAVPLGAPAPSTPIPVTISGSVMGGGKAPYAFTTPRGVKVFIANSSDPAISSQLKASVGQTAQLTGTYIQGSDEMTITSLSTSTIQ